jgi:hypothetical protein
LTPVTNMLARWSVVRCCSVEKVRLVSFPALLPSGLVVAALRTAFSIVFRETSRTSQEHVMTSTNCEPSRFILDTVMVPPASWMAADSFCTSPFLSGPDSVMVPCARFGLWSTGSTCVSSQSASNRRSVVPLTCRPSQSSSTGSSEPRIEDRITVQSREVDADQGMRRCSGRKKNEMHVVGSHTFHMATT